MNTVQIIALMAALRLNPELLADENFASAGYDGSEEQFNRLCAALFVFGREQMLGYEGELPGFDKETLGKGECGGPEEYTPHSDIITVETLVERFYDFYRSGAGLGYAINTEWFSMAA